MQPDPKLNILLVDDRLENLVALESVLSDLNQNLVRASSGLEALRHLLHDDFAVVLLDVQMPGMDGFETATLIRSRARNQHTPIVFLTAINKSDTHVTRGYSVGAVDYVFKPFTPEVLKAKVAAFLELARKTHALQEEIDRRKQAEEEVRQLNEDLECRVVERTAELEAANQELEVEIEVRTRAEEAASHLLAAEQAARAEAEAAQQRLVFISEASALLAGSLEYQATLERVARLAVPYLADFCIVDLVGEDGQVRRLATAHAREDREPLLQALRERYAPRRDSPQPAARVLRSGRAELTSHVDEAWLEASASDPDHLRLLRELVPVSYLVVPLVARGQTIGALSLATAESGRHYGPEDAILAEDLARRAAGALDNARLFREVQEAARRKDEFLAMLAHELRNPLAAIASADYALEHLERPDPRRQARLRGVISRQTQHLSRLVDDLLDMSRINRGNIELRREVVDLAEIVHRAVETNLPLIENRRHELAVALPDEPVCLDADPTRLEQVLSNLLNNAAKYTEPGGRISLRLDVETNGKVQEWESVRNGERERRRDGETERGREGETERGREGKRESPEAGETRTPEHLNTRTPEHLPAQAVLSIRDTGIGIAPDLLPSVFGLFTQADRSSDRSQGGLGIGLALVQKLVRMHGGTVEARSDGLGKGSEFILRLPVVELPSTGLRSLGAPNRNSDLGSQDRKRILLVEDNPDASEALTELLELWGHEVRARADGAAALAEAPAYRPQVVLLDIGLPGMDGYEVARQLRAWESFELENPEPRTPSAQRPTPNAQRMLLIALSGYGQEENRRLSREAGFNLHLTKPVDPDELHRVLCSVGPETREPTAAEPGDA